MAEIGSNPDWMKNKEFIGNLQIHKYADISEKELLQRLEHVEALRCYNDTLKLTYYITQDSDWSVWKSIHSFVRGKDLKYVPGSETRICFGMYVPPAIYQWLRNTSFDNIRRQITLYLSALYANDDSLQDVVKEQIHPLLFSDIKHLYEKYFLNQLKNQDELWDDLYLAASLDYVGALPPPLLIGAYPYKIDREDYALWGITQNNSFRIETGFAYMKQFDWDHIVRRDLDIITAQHFNKKNLKEFKKLSKSDQQTIRDLSEQPVKDSLLRIESVKSAYQKWAHIYKLQDKSSNKFIPIEANKSKGYVYIIRGESGGPCKIGFSNDVEKRKLTLQTGNHERLQIIKFFPATGTDTELALHKLFDHLRKNGEWFDLSSEDIQNIMSDKWRSENGIF